MKETRNTEFGITSRTHVGELFLCDSVLEMNVVFLKGDRRFGLIFSSSGLVVVSHKHSRLGTETKKSLKTFPQLIDVSSRKVAAV